MQNAFKYALALLASLVLTGSLLAAFTGPAQAAQQANFKIVDANLEGGPASVAVAQANATSPVANIMTLQELCRTEFEALINAGWKASGSWASTKTGGCGTGNDKGQAILYRGTGVSSGANATHTALYNPGDTGRTFELTCLGNINGVISDPLFVCTTHLYTLGDGSGASVRETQMNQIENVILPWTSYATRRTVFTGDLNMDSASNSLNQVYGAFKELGGAQGSAGVTTDSNRKLDYIFADKSPALAGSGLGIVENPYSTHDILRGSITFG